MGRWKNKTVWAVLGVFLVLAILYLILAQTTYLQDKESRRAQAELNAQSFTSELQIDFDRGIAVTEILEQLLIDNGGEINDFSGVARRLMEPYISSIQLAPNGVVTEIYPPAGNQSGKIDLMHDPDRGPVVEFGKRNNMLTMQGPFALDQGAVGIALRNPVFFPGVGQQRTFWGFTIVVIKSPEIFRDTIESMTAFGYDYIITATASPLDDEQRVVAASVETLDEPVELVFSEGGSTWRLQIAPVGGWRASLQEILICVVGALFVFFITALSALLLTTRAHRTRLHQMVETDQLTGLLNRAGYNVRVADYMEKNPQGPATGAFLDIDDFKLINDLYGHEIGDEALRNLAKNLRKSFGEDAYLARTGGDEFGIFLPGLDAEAAEPLIRQAAALDQTFTTAEGKTYTYTISIGFSDYPAQAENRSELSRNVDSALYNVKLKGKNGCLRFAPGMSKLPREQLAFTQKELLAHLPGAGFICLAEDKRLLFANKELIRLFECQDLEEFNRITLGLFRNMVLPEDYERVSVLWDEKLARSETDMPIRCRFSVRTKSGQVKPMMAVARYLEHDRFGSLFFVTSLDIEE